MPLPFSNKVDKPLFDFSSLFGTYANSTPMFSSSVQRRMMQPLIPLPTMKTAAAQSTTPSVPGGASTGQSLGSYKGVPIKFGDQNAIIAQMRAIDAAQGASGPSATGGLASTATPTPVPTGGAQGNVRGLMPFMVQSAQAATRNRGENGGEAPTFSGIIFDLIKKATEGNKDVDRARRDLTQFQQNTADKIAAIRSEPIALEFQQGRAQAVQQASAAKEAALQTGVSNALASQQQQLGALESAAGLVSPQQVGAGTTAFNPLTGQPVIGGPTQVPFGTQFLNPATGQSMLPNGPLGGEMGQALAQYAQLLATNQPSGIPSFITSNPVLNAQLIAMARQINPNLNLNQVQGFANAQQSNAEVGGTAGVNVNLQALGPAYQTYLQLQNSVQNIDQFGNLLTQTMQAGGINPFDLKYGNITLAQIRSQLSSEQQAIYDNTLATLRSRVSGLLAAGGSEIPTAITADAQKILDGSLPLSALTGVLQRIAQEGQILLQNQANVVNTAFSGTQGQNTNQNFNAAGSSLFSW